MEVNTEKTPADGETIIFTTGGAFNVKGSTTEIAQRMSQEDWPKMELAETGDEIIIRSSEVVALRGGSKARRGAIGFTHHGQ